MQYSCYRCGAAVEDQTPFCASCGAPQIRVNVAQETPFASDAPATPPLEPGTPASIQPPALPVHFDGRTIVPRKKFLRQIWPFALASGLAMGVIDFLGIVLLIGAIVFCIYRYKSNNPGLFTRSDGTRLGVLTAFISFFPYALLIVTRVAANPETTQKELLQAFQQRLQGPQYQEMLRQLSTHEGLVMIVGLILFFFLIFLLVLGAITGALGASIKADRSHS